MAKKTAKSPYRQLREDAKKKKLTALRPLKKSRSKKLIPAAKPKAEKTAVKTEPLPEPEKTTLPQNTTEQTMQEKTETTQSPASVAPPANTAVLEPMPGEGASPFQTARTEKEYTTQGLKPPPADPGGPAPEMPKEPQSGSKAEEPRVQAPASGPGGPANAGGSAAPPGTAEPFAPPPPGPGPLGGLKLPGKTPEEFIDWIAAGLNMGIRQYAKPLVSLKIHEEFEPYEKVVGKIQQTNAENVERITFSKEEVDYIKGPAVKVMQETGVRGLTPKEELISSAVLLLVVKVGQIKDIKVENQILYNQIINFIREENEKRDRKGGKEKKDDSPDGKSSDQETK